MTSLYTLEADSLPAGVRVLGFRGSAGISRLYRHEVFIDLPSGVEPDLATVLGAPASLVVHDETGAARQTFHGVLNAVEWVDGTLLRIDLVPALWLASLEHHSRVWVDRDLPSILQEVLARSNIAGDALALRLRRRYPAVPHVCQYRETDLSFFMRWTEQLGIGFYFEHDGATERLVLVDTLSDHARAPADPVRFFPTGAGDGSTVESFREFRHTQRASSSSASVRDYNPDQPAMPVSADSASPAPGQGSLVWTFEDDVNVQGAAQRAARVRAEQLRSGHELFQGEGRAYELHPGFKFELEDHPRVALNREYLAVDVDYRGSALAHGEGSAALRAIVGEEGWRIRARAIRADVQFRPPRITPEPRVDGVIIGHVDGPIGSDYAQVDDQGRYVVRLDFDENDNADGATSTRIRMLQPHAGAPEGMHLPLRKGTEVMVVFVGGDPDRPLVAASVPDADTPSPVTSANHTQNVFNSGGDNRFEIEDDAAHRYIDISSPPENTFIHLGAHHDGHQHNSIASTDGNGLVHQGTDQDIFVDGDKTEDVVHEVDEKYDDTQTTNVIQKVTETYHATQTTTVDNHVEEQYESHTTEVTGHKIESCASQETTVTAGLDEHHGAQDTTVGALLDTSCATHTMNVTNTTAQFYANVTYTIGGGGFTVNQDSYFFVDAPNYTVMAPQVTEVENVRTEAKPSKWFVCEAEKTSRVTAKISMIAAVISAVGLKKEANGASIGYTASKTSLLGGKLDISGIKIEKATLNAKSGAIGNWKWAMKLWV